jgi:hypothetical protein
MGRSRPACTISKCMSFHLKTPTDGAKTEPSVLLVTLRGDIFVVANQQLCQISPRRHSLTLFITSFLASPFSVEAVQCSNREFSSLIFFLWEGNGAEGCRETKKKQNRGNLNVTRYTCQCAIYSARSHARKQNELERKIADSFSLSRTPLNGVDDLVPLDRMVEIDVVPSRSLGEFSVLVDYAAGSEFVFDLNGLSVQEDLTNQLSKIFSK